MVFVNTANVISTFLPLTLSYCSHGRGRGKRKPTIFWHRRHWKKYIFHFHISVAASARAPILTEPIPPNH